MKKILNDSRMSFFEMLAVETKQWFETNGRQLLGAASGSMVYLIYGVFFKRHSLGKGLAAFFIGTLFAMYVAPQVWQSMPFLNREFVVFFIGMTGMRLAQALMSLEFKAIFQAVIDSVIKKIGK